MVASVETKSDGSSVRRVLALAAIAVSLAFSTMPGAGAVDAVPPQLDVYFLVDVSGSFGNDVRQLQNAVPEIVSGLRGVTTDVRFGLGKFADYPFSPFGGRSDEAYVQVHDLTDDIEQFRRGVGGLSPINGGDGPESQLAALFQSVTGVGQVVDDPSAGRLYEIPPDQQANFRDDAEKVIVLWTDASFHDAGDPGSIPYPGPSWSETIDALLSVDGLYVLGVAGGTNPIEDLSRVAAATNALAPEGGIDCDASGSVDVGSGEPLVCQISTTGRGIADAIIGLVTGIAVPVNCEGTRATIEGSGTIVGTEGDDVIIGSEGADRIDGRGGDDIVCGRGGDDRIDGGAGNDALNGGPGADKVIGGEGDDRLVGGRGPDELRGGDGVDTADYSGSTARVFLSINLMADDGNRGEGDRIDPSVENAIGSPFNDVILGNDGANRFEGGGGDDLIRGRGGDDVLIGGPGDDRLVGQQGIDTLDGEDGDDVCRGGAGLDIYLHCEIAIP